MILATIMILTILIPSVVGIMFYDRVSAPVKAFVCLLIYKLAGEIFFMITSYAGINNVNLVHWYSVAEMGFLILVFNLIFKRFYVILLPIMCIGVISAFVHSDNFNTIVRLLESGVMSITTLIVYSKPDHHDAFTIKYGPYDDLKTICFGLALYYWCGVVVFYNMDINSELLKYAAWSHICLGFACNIVYTIGLFDAQRINMKLRESLSDNTYNN